MTEEVIQKDYFILKVVLTAAFFIGIALALKSNESDKFAPIKARVQEELQQMNIRVLN